MGDYISGPNHVLPTGRPARVRGGLSVIDFLKVITVQEYPPRFASTRTARYRAGGSGRTEGARAECADPCAPATEEGRGVR